MTNPAGPPTPSDPPVAPPAPPPSGDKGFPEGTPLTEMTDAQQAKYWQHYARKHEDTVKAFKGLTPQEIADMQAENDTLKSAQMSASDKAIAEARKEAEKSASEAAKAQYLPQIQELQVKSIASQIIQGDKLAAFMSIADPSKLVGADGAVDETKVMGTLTAMYGTSGPSAPAGPRWQNAGQNSPPPPGAKPGSAGAAEAAKRFGTKTS